MFGSSQDYRDFVSIGSGAGARSSLTMRHPVCVLANLISPSLLHVDIVNEHTAYSVQHTARSSDDLSLRVQPVPETSGKITPKVTIEVVSSGQARYHWVPLRWLFGWVALESWGSGCVCGCTVKQA